MRSVGFDVILKVATLGVMARLLLRLKVFTLIALLALCGNAFAAEEDKGVLANLISRALSSPSMSVSIGAVDGVLSSDASISNIVISDRNGPWLKVDKARLVWNRLALFSRRLEVDQLTIGRMEFLRRPLASETPPPDTGGPARPGMATGPVAGSAVVPADLLNVLSDAVSDASASVRSIAESVIQKAKEAGRRPLGTEGARDAEWVLVDLQDVLVHVMLPRVREFYALEQLWEVPAAARRASAASSQPRTRTQRGTRRPARRGAAGRGQGR